MSKPKLTVSSGRYDSKLTLPSDRKAPKNCTLTLNLRVLLVRRDVNQIQRKGKTIRCRPWTDDEWKKFVRAVEKLPEKHFNNVFWLRPPGGYSGLDQPSGKPRYRPRVKCALNLIMVKDAKKKNYIRIEAVHLADGVKSMRSHSRLYDHRDVNKKKSGQITVVHEIGHALGLSHPGIRNKVAACLTDGNKDECYEPEEELMAGGMDMIAAYAKPWRKQIARHTKTKANAWKVLMRFERPEPLSFLKFKKDAGKRMRQRLIDSVEAL